MTDIYAPPDDPLEILHEDHEVLVVGKPSGLLSVPGKGEHLADCLLARVQTAFPHALLVHRLDRDTSGVMVFALTPHAQRHLGLQFEKRQVKKAYIARVAGAVAEKSGTVDLPLIVDWPNRPKQMVDLENGKPALTEWRRLKTSACSRKRGVRINSGCIALRWVTPSSAIRFTPLARLGTIHGSCCIRKACASDTRMAGGP